MTIIGGGFVAAEFAHVFSALGTAGHPAPPRPVLLREHDEDISAAVHRARRRPVGPSARDHAHKVAQRRRYDGADALRRQRARDRRTPDGHRAGAERRPARAREHVDQPMRGRVRRSTTTSAPRSTGSGHWVTSAATTGSSTWPTSRRDTVQHNLLHPDDLVASDHRFVPSAVFTSPQIASVGLTSQDARAQGIEHVSVIARLRRHRLRMGDGEHARASISSSFWPTPTANACSARTSSVRRPACCSSPWSRRMSLGNSPRKWPVVSTGSTPRWPRSSRTHC